MLGVWCRWLKTASSIPTEIVRKVRKGGMAGNCSATGTSNLEIRSKAKVLGGAHYQVEPLLINGVSGMDSNNIMLVPRLFTFLS